jgi:hypothetical protein
MKSKPLKSHGNDKYLKSSKYYVSPKKTGISVESRLNYLGSVYKKKMDNQRTEEDNKALALSSGKKALKMPQT